MEQDNLLKLIEEYIDGLTRRPKTKQDYKKILMDYFHYVSNITDSPTRQTIVDYKESLEKRMSPASVQKYIICLRGFYEDLQATGKGINIVLKIQCSTIQPVFKRQPLTLKQARALISRAKRLATRPKHTIEDIRNYALVVLLLGTGLRTIEVERADVKDISKNDEMIRLYIQGKGHAEKDDFVKLSDHIYEALTNYLMERSDDYEPLFIHHGRNVTDENRRISTYTIRTVVKDLLRQIGIDDERYSAHSLRHTAATFATNILHKDTTDIQYFLRHKDPKTTERYMHSLQRENSTIENELGDLLFNDSKNQKGKV